MTVIRIDLQIWPDGKKFLVSPQCPGLRRRVPKERNIQVSALLRASALFRTECEEFVARNRGQAV